MITMDSPVSRECNTYSGKARNMKENSIGSVIPVKKDVSAMDRSRPPMAFLRAVLAVTIMARQAAGRPNIITGKKPAMKGPAMGSPAKKRVKSPCTTVATPSLIISKSPNWNQTRLFKMWCRPSGMSRRLAKP